MPIGKLERVRLREVWKHEALDFTQWLENNIDVLNDCTGLNLVSVEREQPAGNFNVDLLAEDENGATVVIENQLEKSDHDHLGKLITYLTAMGAKAAVWIVAQPRPEHVSAIAWLNESSSADFYLLKLEAIQIGDSHPAALLTPIVMPSEEAVEVGKTKKQGAERRALRLKWWTSLLERARVKTSLHSSISPGVYPWVGTGAGLGGLAFNYSVTQQETKAELYIDRGKGSEEENMRFFEAVRSDQAAIESNFGGELDWESLEGRQACRIAIRFKSGGYRSPEEDWPPIQDEVIDGMIRLEQALRPSLNNLKSS